MTFTTYYRNLRNLLILPCLLTSSLYSSTPKEVSTAKQVFAQIKPYIPTFDREAKSCGLSPDSQTVKGLPEFLTILENHITHNEPLVFYTISFPFKSPNTLKKTLEKRADMAERQAFLNIQKLMSNIQKVYKPGGVFMIFTDGEAFADVLNIPLEDVIQYEADLKKLSKDCPHIRIITLSDLVKGNAEQRRKAISNFPVAHPKSFSEISLKVLSKRVEEEFSHLKLPAAKVSGIAKRMFERDQKVSAFFEKFRPPQGIRVSVHYQKSMVPKLGFNMMPGTANPYHGIAVQENDGHFVIKMKHQLDLSQYKVKKEMINGVSCVFLKKKI